MGKSRQGEENGDTKCNALLLRKNVTNKYDFENNIRWSGTECFKSTNLGSRSEGTEFRNFLLQVRLEVLEEFWRPTLGERTMMAPQREMNCRHVSGYRIECKKDWKAHCIANKHCKQALIHAKTKRARGRKHTEAFKIHNHNEGDIKGIPCSTYLKFPEIVLKRFQFVLRLRHFHRFGGNVALE